jgi:hypothetical protein
MREQQWDQILKTADLGDPLRLRALAQDRDQLALRLKSPIDGLDRFGIGSDLEHGSSRQLGWGLLAGP